MSDTKNIPYLVNNGTLRIAGELKYQDRELRLACMMLLSGPHQSVCLDLSKVPSLCSPEIQFIAKLAESAKQRGKSLRVRLSKGVRELLKQLEVAGVLSIEETEAKILAPVPGAPEGATGATPPASKPSVKPPPPEPIRMPWSRPKTGATPPAQPGNKPLGGR